MGCVVSAKLGNESLEENETFDYTTIFANPSTTNHHHLVSLTSTSYGILSSGSRREVPSSNPAEPTEVMETINIWELMDGLEEESPKACHDVKAEFDNVGTLENNSQVLGVNRNVKSLGAGSPMGGRKFGFGKENERPKQGFESVKPAGVVPVSSLKERSFVGRDIIQRRSPTDGPIADNGFTKGHVAENVGMETVCQKQVSKKISHGPLKDLRIDSPVRFSYDSFKDCTGTSPVYSFKDCDGASPLHSFKDCNGTSPTSTIKYCNGTSPLCSFKDCIGTSPLWSLKDWNGTSPMYSFKDCAGTSPLFDPELLASFETSLDNFEEDLKDSWGDVLENKDSLENYEEKCPPGGQNAVVLYTTTLRGIRKTFEDCNSVRCVLESYGICISERDVSMHMPFRNELEQLMGRIVPVPRLFIKGRYIGGAEEVLRLHEEDKLGGLLEGIPADTLGKVCDGCGGVRFVPCLECSGSCKLVDEDNSVVRCPDCNENGLIQCPICC